MINTISLFSLLIFSIASLSFLFVAYVALKNDPSYKVNQLFSLAFVCAFFYFIFMGLYILPIFHFRDNIIQIFVILGLLFINLSIAIFAIVSEYIKGVTIKSQSLIVIIIAFFIGVLSTFFIVYDFNNTEILIISFTLLNISLTVNSLRFIIVLFNLARKEKEDMFFKKKIYAYNIGFILFNILSALGWALAIFLPLGTELSPLPPGISTFLASLLMVRSFLLKPQKN